MDTLSTLDTSHKAYLATNLNEVHHVIPPGSHVWMNMNGIFWSIFLITLIFSKNLSEPARKKLGWWIGALVLGNFIFNQIHMSLTHTWDASISLPLQLCSLSAFVAAYTLIKGSQTSYEFLIYWGAGAIHSFLTPEITNGSALYNHIEYCISHGCIILGSVYATMRLGYVPRPGSWWKVFLYTQLTLPIIGGINYIFGSNYMYLCQKPDANNPFVIGEWPYYLVGLELVIIIHFYAFYRLHRALAKWKNKTALHYLRPMRSFFSIFFCVMLGGFAILPQPALAQTAYTQLWAPQPPYNNTLNPCIIPAPQSIQYEHGICNTKVLSAAKKRKSSAKPGSIAIQNPPIKLFINPFLSTEGYVLHIKPKSVEIEYSHERGLRYGTHTWQQLRLYYQDKRIPCQIIRDEPRFEYRGMHLDVSRHFFDTNFLYRYAGMAAQYRFNVIHLHLTDDQGWRLESQQFPKLNTVSAYRSGTQTGPYNLQHFDTLYYGGYYKQEQLKRFASLCLNQWGITVIPEIEMPGHALAALSAYPELSCTGGPFQVAKGWGVFNDVFCAGNEATFQFLQQILQETMRIFPNSPYIHIGGDECLKEQWKHCLKCQQRMKDNGLKDEHELQSYLIQRIEKYLQDSGWYIDAFSGDTIHGRNIIGWDEILEGGLAPKATVMSWRGTEGGIAAAQQHHNAIMTPGKPLYWDHYQSKDSTEPHSIGGYNPIENVYAYEPIPASLPDSLHQYILGAQANVWTEYILTTDHVEYMVMPRLPALGEVLWSNPQQKQFKHFKSRLAIHRWVWDEVKYNYSPVVFGEPATFFRNGNKN